MSTEPLARIAHAFSASRNLRALFKPGAENLATVDGLRALSILWVIFHHIPVIAAMIRPDEIRGHVSEPLYRLALNGDLGVDIFFVISGFLITNLLIREFSRTQTLSISQFYGRRALRLLPVYYLYLSILCLHWRASTCDTVWTNLLYINNFVPLDKTCVGFAWSLAIEEQFYIIYPLILFLLLSRKLKALPYLWLGFALACVTSLVVVIHHDITMPFAWSGQLFPVADVARWYEHYYIKPYTRAGALILGAIAAFLHTKPNTSAWFRAHQRWSAMGFAVALWVILSMAFGPGRDPNVSWSRWVGYVYLGLSRNLFAAAVTYVLLLSFSGNAVARPIAAFLGHRVWHPFAQLAYGAYIIHADVVYRVVVNKWPPGERITLTYVFEAYGISVFFTFALATVVFLLIEHPIMNLRPRSRAQNPPDVPPKVVAPASSSVAEG